MFSKLHGLILTVGVEKTEKNTLLREIFATRSFREFRD